MLSGRGPRSCRLGAERTCRQLADLSGFVARDLSASFLLSAEACPGTERSHWKRSWTFRFSETSQCAHAVTPELSRLGRALSRPVRRFTWLKIGISREDRVRWYPRIVLQAPVAAMRVGIVSRRVV